MKKDCEGCVTGMSALLAGFILALALLAAPVLLHGAGTTQSGCVKCHTNEKMLQSLHTPVKVEISEGVG